MDFLELSDVFPLLCWQCLEDFKLCYLFYVKLKDANTNLKKTYGECLNQFVEEEEYLVEETEEEINEEENEISEYIENDDESNREINPDMEDKEEELLLLTENTDCNQNINLHNGNHHPFNENSSLVVTQYVPSTLEPLAKFFNSHNGDDDSYPLRNLLTVDCKAVEVKDVNQLQSLETSLVLANNQTNLNMPSVFLCQYCPKAFAKSEFLKTHIQKTHVCKFCTHPFSLANDLYRHIREVHTEHRCVICRKVLSSSTNLRHHIKRVHRINLPPKITLLDFTQNAKEEEGGSYCLVDREDSIKQLVLDYPEDQYESNLYFTTDDDVVDDMPSDIM